MSQHKQKKTLRHGRKKQTLADDPAVSRWLAVDRRCSLRLSKTFRNRKQPSKSPVHRA